MQVAALVPSLPSQRDDPDEEGHDDRHRDRLEQPLGACDREEGQARDQHEQRQAPPASETTEASVWTPIIHGRADPRPVSGGLGD